MDKQTRQSIAFHVGDRSHESAQPLWANLPAVYRAQATFYTEQYAVYTGVIPAAQHQAITKGARNTKHIERFNNTLRQRVSRRVRDTLVFSTKLANHIGAIILHLPLQPDQGCSITYITLPCLEVRADKDSH